MNKSRYLIFCYLIILVLVLSLVAAGKCQSCSDVYEENEHRIVYRYNNYNNYNSRSSYWLNNDFDCDDHWNINCRNQRLDNSWEDYLEWRDDRGSYRLRNTHRNWQEHNYDRTNSEPKWPVIHSEPQGADRRDGYRVGIFWIN